MFIKNLLRRKIRTTLTIFGISIGVAAIITLGAMAGGMEAGYNSVLTGSKADLIISQPNAFDPSYSAVDESLGEELASLPEVSDISGMIQGFSNVENQPFIFVFGYPNDSFALSRYKILEGEGLGSRHLRSTQGKSLLLGKAAAEVMEKKVGDAVRLVGSVFRVIGIYETGDSFEDSGVLMNIDDAQELLGKPRQVSLFFIRLKDDSLEDRFIARFRKQYRDLEISGAAAFADKQRMVDFLRAYVWVIGGLAIVLGGVGMMNAQLMSVMERTREIGTLRALGWSNRRVLRMILMEALFVCFLGGLLGTFLGYLLLRALSASTVFFGVSSARINSDILIQAFMVVIILGLVGGLYPAWRAGKMLPVEALRYEAGSSGSKIHRLPVGGMSLQSLWQRKGRTMLTMSVIGITVGAIVALEAVLRSFTGQFSDMLGSTAEIMIRQSNISDTELSVIDERVGEKLSAMPGVKAVSGIFFTAVMLPESQSFFIVWGYAPGEFGLQRFRIVEGENLTNNHQVILGRFMANSLHRGVGDTIELSGSRFKVVGIFESKMSWEEVGGVVTLRDVQSFTGRPRKVMMYAVKLVDPSQSESVATNINQQFPEVHATLASDFVEQMPDMKTMDGMIGGISFITILIGGIGVLNTMLMAVFERTREIGVLRALGWQRRMVMTMILKEALLLGLLGGMTGVLIAFALVYLIQKEPTMGAYFTTTWDISVFLRAAFIALVLGLLGGAYPAFRATRLQPLEALRYE